MIYKTAFPGGIGDTRPQGRAGTHNPSEPSGRQTEDRRLYSRRRVGQLPTKLLLKIFYKLVQIPAEQIPAVFHPAV